MTKAVQQGTFRDFEVVLECADFWALRFEIRCCFYLEFFLTKPSHDSSARNVTAFKVLKVRGIWYCLDSVSTAVPLPTAEIVQKGGSSVIRSPINIDGSEI